MTLTALAVTVGFAYWLNFSPVGKPLAQSPPQRFRELLVDIRTMAISPYDAEKRFQAIMRELHRNYPPAFTDSAQVKIVFPLLGKNYRSVGGNGQGFRGNGFDLFDHTVSGSHPAHDIFIYDRNHDCIEDTSGEYIGVVAVSGGVVIANEMDWHEGMDFRGGNYVWLYDFQTGGLWYYAHLREVYVYPGQLVKAGDKIGEVGRSGFNAIANRSDTHLHLMHLAMNDENLPRPMDTFGWLKNAETVYSVQMPVYMRPRIQFEEGRIEKIPFRQIPATGEIPEIKSVEIPTEHLPVTGEISKIKPVNIPVEHKIEKKIPTKKTVKKRRSTPWTIK